MSSIGERGGIKTIAELITLFERRERGAAGGWGIPGSDSNTTSSIDDTDDDDGAQIKLPQVVRRSSC